MTEINGLPVGFFVVAGGIILVLVSWLLMRFGRTIAKAVLTIAGLGIALVIALAVLAQGAASVQTATAAKETAQVAQTASTANLVLVGALGCFGGVAFLAVAGALGVAGYFWLKSRQVPKKQLTTPGHQALPDPQSAPVVWVVGDAQRDSVDLSGVDFSQWGW